MALPESNEPDNQGFTQKAARHAWRYQHAQPISVSTLSPVLSLSGVGGEILCLPKDPSAKMSTQGTQLLPFFLTLVGISLTFLYCRSLVPLMEKARELLEND